MQLRLTRKYGQGLWFSNCATDDTFTLRVSYHRGDSLWPTLLIPEHVEVRAERHKADLFTARNERLKLPVAEGEPVRLIARNRLCYLKVADFQYPSGLLYFQLNKLIF